MICVSYLSNDMVHGDFTDALVGMCMHSAQTQQLALNHVQCTIISEGRNRAVQGALQIKASHVLFLDSDMVFPADTLIRLLAHDLPIVGATYCSRRPRPDIGKRTLVHLGPQLADALHGPVPVESLPMGCTLIRADVFEKVPQPWFRFDYHDGQIIGEDVGFCRAATTAGIPIHMDADLSRNVYHLATVPLSHLAAHGA